MKRKKIIFGFLIALLAIACTKDEILIDRENTFLDQEVTDNLLKNETQYTDGSKGLTKDLVRGVYLGLERSPRSLTRKSSPLCTEIRSGVYSEVKIIYFNFSGDRFIERALVIIDIRQRYENHYNLGECQEIIIPSSFTSIVCEGETCSESWYFFSPNKPEGGGTLKLDVEASGP